MDTITAEIDELSAVIEDLLAPMRNSCSRPGRCPAGASAAQNVIAGTGTGMTRFPAPAT